MEMHYKAVLYVLALSPIHHTSLPLHNPPLVDADINYGVSCDGTQIYR